MPELRGSALVIADPRKQLRLQLSGPSQFLLECLGRVRIDGLSLGVGGRLDSEVHQVAKRPIHFLGQPSAELLVRLSILLIGLRPLLGESLTEFPYEKL